MTKFWMRAACAALAATAAAAVPTLALAADDAPMTVVRTFMNAFNKGDIPGAQATHAADAAIIDEVPPHQWHGPGAFTAWLGDLAKNSAATGQTDEHVAMGPVVREQVDGDNAYVVMKVVFTYKLKGVPTTEDALFTAALGKQGDAWKITGWAWAGEVPKPAK